MSTSGAGVRGSALGTWDCTGGRSGHRKVELQTENFRTWVVTGNDTTGITMPQRLIRETDFSATIRHTGAIYWQAWKTCPSEGGLLHEARVLPPKMECSRRPTFSAPAFSRTESGSPPTSASGTEKNQPPYCGAA